MSWVTNCSFVGMEASNGCLLLGRSIADDVAHNTKRGSIARAQEEINSSFAFAIAFAFVPVGKWAPIAIQPKRGQ